MPALLLKSAKSSYEATSASAKQTQAYFEKSQDNLKKTRISSPMHGIITFVDVEVGEIAAGAELRSLKAKRC